MGELASYGISSSDTNKVILPTLIDFLGHLPDMWAVDPALICRILFIILQDLKPEWGEKITTESPLYKIVCTSSFLAN